MKSTHRSLLSIVVTLIIKIKIMIRRRQEPGRSVRGPAHSWRRPRRGHIS